jgi:hypothetical protein
MSSPASFEVLHAVSQRLADDFIDEDMSEIQMGNREVMNRTVTVRGRHRDRGVVLQYSDFFSEVIDPLKPAIYERNVLELFVTQPRITFEGTCRDRTLWDKLARFFGGGGLKGDADVFDACRIDATDAGNVACLMHRPFSDLLQQMAQRPGCRRVKMQAGAGVGPVLSFYSRATNPDAIMTWLDQGAALAATLDA